MDDFEARIAEILKDHPMTQQELGDLAGVSKGMANQWVNGKAKSMSYEAATRINAKYGYSIPWLMNGQGAKLDSEASPAGMMPIRTWEHPDDLPAGEYAYIARLTVHLSAGNGHDQIALEFVKEQPQAFRADWIRQKRLKPAKLAVMTVRGDSMEDRLHDGDALVVDTSQTDVIDGKVYALWYEGGERVKRLYRRPGGGLILHSDNTTKYPPMTMTPDECAHVRIIGRVVHVSGDGGL